MSRKSPPRKAATARGTRAGGSPNHQSPVEPVNAPFEVVLLVAGILAGPTLLAHLTGEMSIDATLVRVVGALAVAWVLANLVVAVIRSVRPVAADGSADPDVPTVHNDESSDAAGDTQDDESTALGQ